MSKKNQGSPQGPRWTDLAEMYRQCCELNQQPAKILPLLKDEDLLSNVDNRSELNQIATLLSRDVTDFTSKLSQINALHATRAGDCKDADELMLMISVNEKYLEWILQYNEVVMPNVQSILTLFDAASAKQQAAKRAAAAEAAPHDSSLEQVTHG